MFRFASWYFLLMLAIVPAAILYKKRRQLHPVMGLPALSAVHSIRRSAFLKLHWIMPVLKYTALCLAIAAMARPQMGTRQVSVLTEGVNLVLAVDISESMAALDFKQGNKIVNRLEAVKTVINEFISKRSGDRIGLVVFGTHAYTQLPLTRDYNTISAVLERLKIGAAGKNTAIGDAIGISLKRLEDIKSKSNIIILLTDGQSNTGEFSPQTATEIAVQKGVKIYTVGVGSKGKAPFLIQHPLLGESYIYQHVDFDEDTLKFISKETNGIYFRAADSKSLGKIYDTIDELEKTKVKVKTFAEYRELYIYLLAPSFLLLVVWVILSNTRFLRVP
ncbi:MAG: VWA domain-containing protein [Desulfobacterales bacterium]|uniref:VWA domain-containing protein n=1 Tax=Candidatus Desulfatibia vada TaxID=2841696 RepID=A0A8J6TNQ1_9BACT|nr:VWA domain-containing protein [Candidatus Desulfatibia vada]MBL6971952.1 VWA domain-containing protein [Desulfobacterales bacterium]